MIPTDNTKAHMVGVNLFELQAWMRRKPSGFNHSGDMEFCCSMYNIAADVIDLAFKAFRALMRASLTVISFSPLSREISSVDMPLQYSAKTLS